MTGRTSQLRASDAERERAAADLRHHFAAGRMAADELEQRLERAYSARTRAELRSALADLPSLAPRRAMTRLDRFQRRALRAHAAGYAGVNGTLIGVWALTGGAYFWPAWLLVPGTALLGCHAAGARAFSRAAGRAEPKRLGRGGARRQARMLGR
jgi:hypothetical protein